MPATIRKGGAGLPSRSEMSKKGDPGTGDVPPKSDRKSGEPVSSRKGVGGSPTHGPLCTCNPCKARRRTQEALTSSAGARGIRLADESVPLQQITTERGLKRPVDEKFRGRIAQYIYYKMSFPDASVRELATKMGVDRNALYRLIKNGRESGLLDFDDPLERIEFEIIPKVVDNLNHFLDAKDKTVTIEAAKGTIFRQYQDSKGISDANTTVLALKIEPSDGQEVKVMTGHIVGTPKGLPLGNLNET